MNHQPEMLSELLRDLRQDVQRGQERSEERFDQLRDELHVLRAGSSRIVDRVYGVERRVEALEGPVAEFRHLRSRIGGLVISGSLAVSAIGTVWTLCGDYVRDHLSWR
ncbi:hypothetical protein [Granulibacter bethesdensis]|uniref:Membrane associated protein n=2 Tax=Granulibacter bethesdensis TaxID=364410 RepID=Q0BRV5_GRABC|nr:hypothetical protein [Granulibacter bethesdensis]ABI62447.1 putative membrane associated protein [Granulibacter bethesdensis CGDNIH1]AHJ63431.1 putative membrane associated protein [Granulibacter bethesdensis]AHJ65989.1 putative membrane associated protein [Granulibacter bethesdensis CGDNIH4]AHJ68618.1 putative membrane associated protein [Granulibacter bethesdensis]APH52283.1 putative membrane associated protein [Granulibacter bethesdensis]